MCRAAPTLLALGLAAVSLVQAVRAPLAQAAPATAAPGGPPVWAQVEPVTGSARSPGADLRILVNGTLLQPDVPPFIEQGRTQVPLRAVFQALGAEVEWDGATHTVTATRRGRQVVLTVGAPTARVDGQEVPLDVPARIVDNRTFVPLRFVAEALGASVGYDAAARTVLVVDLNYLAQGRRDADLELLARAALAGPPDAGDLEVTLHLGPTAGAGVTLDQRIAAQVRGAEGYARMDQELVLGGTRVPGVTELAIRGGHAFLRSGGEPWQDLGPGAFRLDRLGLPGGVDPMYLLRTPLIGAVATLYAGPAESAEEEEHQTLTLTFDPTALAPFFASVARGYGVSLEGVTFDSLKGTLQVRARDGLVRRASLQFAWKAPGTGPGGEQTWTPWALSLDLAWSPPAGPIAWPADLPR